MATSLLIVDDHPGNLRLLSFAMRRSGHHVTTATSGAEALAALGQAVPDLVLLDMQMPGMSGFHLAQLLKADPRYAAIPLVAVTAFAMRGDEEKARAAGCDAYVTKPIDVVALRALVERLTREGGVAMGG